MMNTIPTLDVTNGVALENEADPGIMILGDDMDFDVLTVSISGVDAALFSLTGDTVDTAPFANLVFNTAPDFEMPLDADGDNVYEVTVELSDGVNVVTQDITITVEDDVNETAASGNAPVFVSDVTQTVDEGETAVTTLLANDADGDTVTYAITGGDDAFEFVLAGPDGDVLAFNSPQDPFPFTSDSNFDGEYEVEVTATDGINNTVQTFFVGVNDVNTPPELSAFDGLTFEGMVGTESPIDAFDNLDMGDVLTISLSGDDADFFTFIVEQDGPAFLSGHLEFIDAPDFEMPLDANGDNIYEVTVELFDGVNTVTEDITITVEDDPSDNGTMKTSDSALSSFSLEDDGVIYLSESVSDDITVDDIFAAELSFGTIGTADMTPAQATFEQDIDALEMQFAADLLMVQDSGAALDG